MLFGPLLPSAGCWFGCQPHARVSYETFYQIRRKRFFMPIQIMHLLGLMIIAFSTATVWHKQMIMLVLCTVVFDIAAFVIWCRNRPFQDRYVWFIKFFALTAVSPSIHLIRDIGSGEPACMVVGRRIMTILTCYMFQLFAFGSRSGQLFLLPVPSLLVYLGFQLTKYLDGSMSKALDFNSTLLGDRITLVCYHLLLVCGCWCMPNPFTAVVPVAANPSTILPSNFGNASSSPIPQISEVTSVSDDSDGCASTSTGFKEQAIASGSECMHCKTIVLQMSGKLILEIPAEEAWSLSVQQLKGKVSDTLSCSPEYCRLSLGDLLLEDVCKLSAIMRPGETLVITAVLEVCERGPFALGQEASWGDWENMSANSEQLDLFDGRWELIIDKAKSVACAVPVCPGGWPPLRILEISAGIGGRIVTVQDKYEIGLMVRADGVFLAGGRLRACGDELHRVGTTGEKHRYKRVVEP